MFVFFFFFFFQAEDGIRDADVTGVQTCALPISTDMLVLMARTGDADSGAKGISTFVIPANAEGVSYGKNEEKMGWHSQPTRLVTLEDVRIPASNRIGNEGDGFAIAMKGLDGGRL